MADTSERDFIQFGIAETARGRGYWLDRPWVDDAQRPALATATILALPSQRGDEDAPYFPTGSEAFLERLRGLLGPETSFGVAIRSTDYQELALHSKAWRLPNLFVSYVAIPLVINILATRINDLLPDHKHGDTAEISLTIEGEHHKTMKLHFKGDPKDLGPLLTANVARFIDKLDNEPDTAHQIHPRARHRAAP